MATVVKPPTKGETVKVCDLCGQEDGTLQECVVCGADYCITDDAIVPGSYGFLKMCRDCGQREDVRVICENFSSELTPIFDARRSALSELPAEPQ